MQLTNNQSTSVTISQLEIDKALQAESQWQNTQPSIETITQVYQPKNFPTPPTSIITPQTKSYFTPPASSTQTRLPELTSEQLKSIQENPQINHNPGEHHSPSTIVAYIVIGLLILAIGLGIGFLVILLLNL